MISTWLPWDRTWTSDLKHLWIMFESCCKDGHLVMVWNCNRGAQGDEGQEGEENVDDCDDDDDICRLDGGSGFLVMNRVVLYCTWVDTVKKDAVYFCVMSVGRVQLKCDGTRWRTGWELKGKLANAVGSQYSSHYLATWCIQHYYRWCAHLGWPIVDWTVAPRPI